MTLKIYAVVLELVRKLSPYLPALRARSASLVRRARFTEKRSSADQSCVGTRRAQKVRFHRVRDAHSKIAASNRSHDWLMSLVTIGVLVGVVFGVLRLLMAANERKPPHAPPGPLGTWGGHSDYRQLRIEYHREVDRSLSPPRH